MGGEKKSPQIMRNVKKQETRLLSLRHHFVPQHCLARCHKMVKRTRCDGDTPTLKKKKQNRKEKKKKTLVNFFFCKDAVCVYVTDRCFYHRSLRSGSK